MKKTEYQIKDKDGITFGRFQKKEDRDFALQHHTSYGFPAEE